MVLVVTTISTFSFGTLFSIWKIDDRSFWTDDAQFEITRILFFPTSQAIELGNLYDEIKSVDSRYRNLLTETNRLIRRLNDQRRAEGAKESNLAAIAALKAAFSGEQEALNKLDG